MPNRFANGKEKIECLFRFILNYAKRIEFLSQKCHTTPFNVKFATGKIYTVLKYEKA